MIVSAFICTFSMIFFASYSLFVFSRTCVRISGSSQSQSFISSSRFLPAADSEKYISRLSVFPITREISLFFSTAQIIFEVLEKTIRQFQCIFCHLIFGSFCSFRLIFQRIIFNIFLFLINNKLFFKSFPVILD